MDTALDEKVAQIPSLLRSGALSHGYKLRSGPCKALACLAWREPFVYQRQDLCFLFSLIYLQMHLQVLLKFVWEFMVSADQPSLESFSFLKPHNRKWAQSTFYEIIHQHHRLRGGLIDIQRSCICSFASYAYNTHKGEKTPVNIIQLWTTDRKISQAR